MGDGSAPSRRRRAMQPSGRSVWVFLGPGRFAPEDPGDPARQCRPSLSAASSERGARSAPLRRARTDFRSFRPSLIRHICPPFIVPCRFRLRGGVGLWLRLGVRLQLGSRLRIGIILRRRRDDHQRWEENIGRRLETARQGRPAQDRRRTGRRLVALIGRVPVCDLVWDLLGAARPADAPSAWEIDLEPP